MSKHTAGPWEVDVETGEITAQGAVLGTIYGADDYPCCEEDVSEECRANARLIAAAPEMLEALKATEAAINLELYSKIGALRESPAWAGLAGSIQAVIRKAEGQ